MNGLRDTIDYGTHCATCGGYIGGDYGFTLHCSKECANARFDRYSPTEAMGTPRLCLWRTYTSRNHRRAARTNKGKAP